MKLVLFKIKSIIYKYLLNQKYNEEFIFLEIYIYNTEFICFYVEYKIS